MSLVKIRNIGTTPYTLPHAVHGDAVIPPGIERIVHLEVALVYLGNPATRNLGPSQPERLRDGEIKRIHTLWGHYPGLHTPETWTEVGLDLLAGKPEGPLCPRLEVYDLDGNRMWMIHDDPEGVHRSDVVADRIVDVTSGHAVEAEIASLKEQVRRLTDILVARQDAEGVAAPPSMPFVPGSDAAKIAAALENDAPAEQRFDIPKAPAAAAPVKDKPRTSRTGSRQPVG